NRPARLRLFYPGCPLGSFSLACASQKPRFATPRVMETMNPCIRLPDCHGRSCDALPIDLFFLQKQQGASDELPFAHDHGRLLRTGRHYTKRSGPQSPQR
ncbi:hypothetical protein, partial [Pseudomonas protegens]|uniref:hypothetical protein n=1 Tax=Pseudomonas protegens TaxID=380021 RepID=UPI00195A0F7E